ncbi:acyl-CoA dehydrogenase family protein [Nonomuraea antimicrobica]|uniref:Acyl-CoA dehydrogenase family protein n=1 Tax=Nonomuraea antimicrobica TaxID=561173 RepID=A0ABP7D288_9ACTN
MSSGTLTTELPGAGLVPDPAWREAAEAVAAVASEHADQADRDAAFPAAALAEMRRTRLLGLPVPVEHGGWGGGFTELADATIALARADMTTALVFAMHCQQATAVVRHGDPQLLRDLLPTLARGEIYLGSVTTEPGTGGQLLTSESPLQESGGTLVIDRVAPVVTGGRHADAFLVTMRSAGAASPTQVDLVYAARDHLEVEVTGGWDPLGMRATESVPLRLRGAVPATHLIGGPGGFPDIAAGLFGPVAHIGWAAAWLGTAAGALARVIRYVRGQSGPRGLDVSSPLVLSNLAVIRERVDTVHALLRHTLRVVADEETRHGAVSSTSARLLVNTLKTRASEECFAAVNGLVELVGLRHGYLKGSPTGLERAFRDLRSASLNFANDRLRTADGAMALRDVSVRLV